MFHINLDPNREITVIEDSFLVIKVITPGGFVLDIDPDRLSSSVNGIRDGSRDDEKPERISRHLANLTQCRVTVELTTTTTSEPVKLK